MKKQTEKELCVANVGKGGKRREAFSSVPGYSYREDVNFRRTIK